MWLKTLRAALLALAFALPTGFALTGCEDDSADIDDIGDNIEEGFKDAGRGIEDAVD